MNEVLAKGIKAKEVARGLCLNLQSKNEALSAIADQLILETTYFRRKQEGY